MEEVARPLGQSRLDLLILTCGDARHQSRGARSRRARAQQERATIMLSSRVVLVRSSCSRDTRRARNRAAASTRGGALTEIVELV